MRPEADIGAAARNLGDSLARLKETTINYGRGQIEGLRDSVEEEGRRRATMLASAIAIFVLLCLCVVFAGVAVIIAFRDTYPALAAAGVAVTLLLFAGVAAWVLRRAQRRKPSAVGWVMTLLFTLLSHYRGAPR
jgi:uncharacterized membrane protein YqjE